MMMMIKMMFFTLIVAFVALPFITHVGCSEKKGKYMGMGQFPNKTLLLITWDKYLYFIPYDNYDSWQNRWRFDNVSKVFLEDVWDWVLNQKGYKDFTEEIKAASLVKHGHLTVLLLKGEKKFILLVLDSKKIIGPVDGAKIHDYAKLKLLSYTTDLTFFEVKKQELNIIYYDHLFKTINKTLDYLRCADGTVVLKPAECAGGKYEAFPDLQNGFHDHLDNFLFEDSENMYIFPVNGGKMYNSSIDDYFYEKRTSNLLLFMLFLIIIIALIELCLLIKCGYDQAKQEEELSQNQGLGTYADYTGGGGTGGTSQGGGASTGGGGATQPDPALAPPKTPGSLGHQQQQQQQAAT